MNKKGFTLIELLAVIVILAILALIVSPIISGVIKDARKSAAASSLNGYARTLEATQYAYIATHQGEILTDVAQLQADAQAKNKETITNFGTVTIAPNSGIVTAINGAVINGFTCNYTESAGATCEG